ncbi:unnamed protein product, partial [marine sediment metagenome]
MQSLKRSKMGKKQTQTNELISFVSYSLAWIGIYIGTLFLTG